jgi:hypothetical protein
MCNIRKKIIERAINHTKRNVVFPDLDTLKSIGFVLDGETDEKEASWKFQNAQVNVQFIRFVDQKRGTDTRQNTIYRSDLNFWKLPPSRLVHPFIDTPFDILINLAGINNDAVTYICAASKANFKVCYKPLGKIYDLVIELEEWKKSELIKETFHALTHLSNNNEETKIG